MVIICTKFHENPIYPSKMAGLDVSAKFRRPSGQRQASPILLGHLQRCHVNSCPLSPVQCWIPLVSLSAPTITQHCWRGRGTNWVVGDSLGFMSKWVLFHHVEIMLCMVKAIGKFPSPVPTGFGEDCVQNYVKEI